MNDDGTLDETQKDSLIKHIIEDIKKRIVANPNIIYVSLGQNDNTDLFLYDVKCITEELHKEGTGESNRLILENLEKLQAEKVEITVRIPVIPEFNGSDF